MASRSSLFGTLLAVALLAPAASAQPAGAAAPAAAPAPADAGAPSAADAGRKLPEEEPNTCASCHATLPEAELHEPARKYRSSVHRDDRIGCVGCHKGDPRDPTVSAHNVAGGFTPRPKHENISKICGSCHENVAFVRRFRGDLNVDQKPQYDSSLHGRLANAGDPGAPSCTSCHGVHDIQPASSLESPVHRTNVSDLCGKCHADAAKMKPYKIKTDQLAGWQRSSHAVAFAAGNPKAPTCIGCHGPHASLPPVASTAGRVCGHCHEAELEQFTQSPHTKPFDRLGLAECTPCHGNHDVVRTSWLAGFAADSACGRCHARDEKPKKVIAAISEVLKRARERGEKASTRVAAARAQGLPVAQASFSVNAITSAELKLRTMVHSLDLKRLEGPAQEVDIAADQVEAIVVNAERTRQLRHRGYYAALGIALLLFLLLIGKAFQLDRRRRRGAA